MMYVILNLLILVSIISSFEPDTSSFDAYGLKIAANEVLLVQSIPSDSSFLLRLSPYSYDLTCTIAYNDSDQYILAVAVASQTTYNDSIRFGFIGVNTETNVLFIGSLTYTGILGTTYANTVKKIRKSTFPCDGWNAMNYRIHELDQFVFDEFFVFTFSPKGDFAYGFSTDFLLIYDLNNDNVSTQLGRTTWPNASFLPHAVDVSQDLLFVIIGYVGDSSTEYTPCAYLLNITNSNFTVLDTWLYTPPSNTSWQASLTNWDADVYAAKYDMSVSIDQNGSQVLFGIPIMNSIVLIDLDRANQTFGSSIQSLSNGQAIGMGKTVGWLDTNLILILMNTYSLNYVWSSSQIFVYNVTIADSFEVISIFPNVQQTLSSAFGPIFLATIVTVNGTVVILDSQGNYYILLPSSPGYYSDSSSGTSSSSTSCISGTYSSQINILPCSLCPSGTTTNGLTGQSLCVSCDNNAFCPLGSAFGNIDQDSSLLQSITQLIAYPVSPQSTRFDNILIQKMFTIHTSKPAHCLVKFPLFWAIIVILVGLFIWFGLFIFKRYVTHPLGKKTELKLKRFFKKTDLIGEGEMVIGGLFSFAVIVLVGFAYTFSYSYFYRYPIDSVSQDSTDLVCDTALTNAQFSSGLMALSIPPSQDQAPINEMLDAQTFILYIDLINTVMNCTQISVKQIKDINIPMSMLSCNDTSSTVSFSLLLPSHDISLQVQLIGIYTIGGLRISLEGTGEEMENDTLEGVYKLLDLTYSQFLFMSDRILTQKPSCSIQLTKVINRTYSLEEDGETTFSGVWLPTLTGSLNQMFVDTNEYLYATSTSTILSIIISETSYYVLNIQKPITDQAELIFTDLLFTILCLEIFGLGFLVSKLILLALIKKTIDFVRQLVRKKHTIRERL